MRLSAKVERVAIPTPSFGRSSRVEKRTGLVFHLCDLETGLVGSGEASPLAGYSQESLEESETCLLRLVRSLEVLGARDPLRDRWPSAEFVMPSSARFALDCARIDLMSKLRGVSFSAALTGETYRASESLEECVTFDAFEPRLTEHVTATLDAMSRCRPAPVVGALKFKLAGRERYAEELANLRELAKTPLAALPWRFDFNQALIPQEVQIHLEALQEFSPEYVEEPVQGGLLWMPSTTLVPIAADESLQVSSVGELAAAVRLAAIVLKPTTLGGLQRSLALAEEARGRGLGVSVTHCWEGPIGNAAVRALAQVVPGRLLACGLRVGSMGEQ